MMLAAVAFLTSCDGRPNDVVIENGRMIIYHKKETTSKRGDRGKWEYWVRDNSTYGWALITDEEYNVGDRLQIKVFSHKRHNSTNSTNERAR